MAEEKIINASQPPQDVRVKALESRQDDLEGRLDGLLSRVNSLTQAGPSGLQEEFTVQSGSKKEIDVGGANVYVIAAKKINVMGELTVTNQPASGTVLVLYAPEKFYVDADGIVNMVGKGGSGAEVDPQFLTKTNPQSDGWGIVRAPTLTSGVSATTSAQLPLQPSSGLMFVYAAGVFTGAGGDYGTMLNAAGYTYFTPGGSGGGGIVVMSDNIEIKGTLDASGSKPPSLASVLSGSAYSTQSYMAAVGGAGGGGSIYLLYRNSYSSSGTVRADGGLIDPSEVCAFNGNAGDVCSGTTKDANAGRGGSGYDDSPAVSAFARCSYGNYYCYNTNSPGNGGNGLVVVARML